MPNFPLTDLDAQGRVQEPSSQLLSFNGIGQFGIAWLVAITISFPVQIFLFHWVWYTSPNWDVELLLNIIMWLAGFNLMMWLICLPCIVIWEVIDEKISYDEKTRVLYYEGCSIVRSAELGSLNEMIEKCDEKDAKSFATASLDAPPSPCS